MPARSPGIGGIQLIQFRVILVHDQDVAVAGGVGAALDRDIGGNGIRTGIALVRVVERHRHVCLRTGNDHVRDADRGTVPDGPEIGMQSRVETNAVDQRRGIRIDGIARDVAVPGIIGGEDLQARDRAAAAAGRRR